MLGVSHLWIVCSIHYHQSLNTTTPLSSQGNKNSSLVATTSANSFLILPRHQRLPSATTTTTHLPVVTAETLLLWSFNSQNGRYSSFLLAGIALLGHRGIHPSINRRRRRRHRLFSCPKVHFRVWTTIRKSLLFPSQYHHLKKLRRWRRRWRWWWSHKKEMSSQMVKLYHPSAEDWSLSVSMMILWKDSQQQQQILLHQWWSVLLPARKIRNLA